MKKLYSKLLFGVLCLLCSVLSFAQVSVTATSGTTGPTSYATLKAAFDAINAGTHKGTITVNITGNTTETATAALNASVSPASYTAVNITTSGSFSVNMNAASALLELKGAKNVILDGNNTLQLINTNAGGHVLRFSNDAANNIIRNTIIKGATNLVTSGLPTAGIVSFGTGTTTGNNNNTIDNCDIDGTSTASCAIFSQGTYTDAAKQNRGNIIKKSKIHDNISASSTASIGLFLMEGNTAWTIDSNSFYHSGTVSLASQFAVRSMLIWPSWTSDYHLVRGNYFGGNAPAAAGTMTLAASGTNVIGYIGMDVQTGGDSGIVINNTVRNINLTYNSSLGSFTNSAISATISGFDGTSILYKNNVSNLSFTNNAGSMALNGIACNGRTLDTGVVAPQFGVIYNTVDNLTTTAGGTGTAQLFMVRLETSSGSGLTSTSIANPYFYVDSNFISNGSVPFASSNSTVRGIAVVNTQGGTSPNFSTAGLAPNNFIYDNTIHTLSSTSTLASYSTGTVTGIHSAGSSVVSNNIDLQIIEHNTIYNLTASNTTDVATVTSGIIGTNGMYDISNNKIYDLKNQSSGATTTPGIVGVSLRSAFDSSYIMNNFISLGNGVTNNAQIFGIINNFNATGPVLVYHNSVVIGGTANAGNTNRSAAFIRGTETFGNTITTPTVLKNNIFYNTRTGGTGANYAIANTYTTAPANWTSDYNDLYNPTAANTALWGTTAQDLTAYKTASGDANSKAVAVNFVNVATGDLHLTGTSLTDANLNGTPVIFVTNDIDGDPRSTTSPKMGADEPPLACVAPAITTQPVAQSACAGTNATFTVAATGTNLTYQWRYNNSNIVGANSATYTLNNVGTSSAGTYDVVVSNTCGTVTSSAVALTVNAAPTITTQPAAQALCTGANGTLTVVASGTGTITYQWKKDGTNITGATSASYVINNAAASHAGSYTVVVSNGTCSVTSAAAAVTVGTGATITTQPAAQAICSGNNATFSVVASGSNLTYQWRKDGTNITGATAANYTITGATAANAGNYTVVVTSACGSVTSNAVALTINAVTAITTQPAAQSVCANSPASFTVVATGANLAYQWRKNGANITGATSATYQIPSVVAADAANYDVVVTGACGSVTSAAVSLAVNTCTAVPVVDVDVTSAVLMPNIVRNQSVLRLTVKRAMKVDWTITDANGKVVRAFSKAAAAGRNDITLTLDGLSAGTYLITGNTTNGRTEVLRFVKL